MTVNVGNEVGTSLERGSGPVEVGKGGHVTGGGCRTGEVVMTFMTVTQYIKS